MTSQTFFDGDKIASMFSPKATTAENVSPYFQHSFQNTGNQSPSGDQSSRSSLLKDEADPAGFQEDPTSFHGSPQSSQPSAQADSTGADLHTENPNDETTALSDDENCPSGAGDLPLSCQLGEMASELKDEVMQLLPVVKEQEAHYQRIVESAKQLLRDAIQYRTSLDQVKHQYAARLGQVAEVLASKK